MRECECVRACERARAPEGPDVGGAAVALAAEDLGGDGGEAAEAGAAPVEEPVQRAVVGQPEPAAAAHEEAVGRLQVAVEHLPRRNGLSLYITIYYDYI